MCWSRSRSALVSGYFIDNPIHRLRHDPKKIVGLYVQPGMTVIDVGSICGTVSMWGETIVIHG